MVEKMIDARARRELLAELMEPSEPMIERGIWQSHHYPVVPDGYENDKKPIHRFELRQVFRAMIVEFAKEHGIAIPKER